MTEYGTKRFIRISTITHVPIWEQIIVSEAAVAYLYWRNAEFQGSAKIKNKYILLFLINNKNCNSSSHFILSVNISILVFC